MPVSAVSPSITVTSLALIREACQDAGQRGRAIVQGFMEGLRASLGWTALMLVILVLAALRLRRGQRKPWSKENSDQRKTA